MQKDKKKKIFYNNTKYQKKNKKGEKDANDEDRFHITINFVINDYGVGKKETE